MSYAGTPATDRGRADPSIRARFERELEALRASATGIAAQFIRDDAKVRHAYVESVEHAVREIRREVEVGEVSLEEGARRANLVRNEILEAMRRSSSGIARTYARKEKPHGPTFAEMLVRKAEKAFQKAPDALTPLEREEVMRKVLESAAKPDAQTTRFARRIGRASRGLVALSLGLSAYNIYNAEDRGEEAAREGVGLVAGLGGNLAGTAAGSLVCGPAALPCMGIFVIAGGVAFALGVDLAIWGW